MERKLLLEELKSRAAALLGECRYQEAMTAARRIQEIDELSLEALHILAVCHMQLAQYEESIALLKEIISKDPSYIGAYMVLAYIYKRRYQIGEEIEMLQLIITFLGVKNSGEASRQDIQYYAEAYSLLGSAYTLLGDTDRAGECFLLSSRIDQDPRQKIAEYSNYLFTTNYGLELTRAEMFAAHRKYNAFFRDVQRCRRTCGDAGQKIKIGYISPDFREHAVVFFSYALLAEFDRDEFTVTCYSLGEEDDLTERLKQMTSDWRDLRGVDADSAAEMICRDEIDILVDLAGHTAHNALPVLARRPAPVQISGIGYFNTTGLDEIDYFLTDIHCDPEGKNDVYFSEKLIRLPHSHLCYTPCKAMPDCGEAPFIKNGYLTFGSFNNFSKVSETTLVLWSAVLARIPTAKLILKSRVFGSTFGKDAAIRRLQSAGIDEDRVELRGFTAEYLREYHDIDIALDTYPYPGGATTCEALYMGVPVITLAGSRHGARFGYSLLKNVGIDELIAHNENEYVEKVAALADDKELLRFLRKNLRRIMQKSPLMDAKRYVGEVESAYKAVWNSARERQGPLVSILIPTYNRPYYFQIALESARQQTYANIEIIVCDNGTDDRTEKLMWAYRGDSRIRYVRNRAAKTKEENFHPFEKLARGEFLQWLMDDDVLHPRKIERMVRCFQENPDVTLVTSCRRWIDGEGNLIPNPSALRFDAECKILDGSSLGKNMLTHISNLIGEPSAFLFRAKDLRSHYWNADCRGYKTISDVAMGLELLERGNCGYFSEALSAYRRHAGQEGQQIDTVVLSRLEWLSLADEYYARHCFLETEKEYSDTLALWLKDAERILPAALAAAAPDERLLEKYQEQVAKVRYYFAGENQEELLQAMLKQRDFAGMIGHIKNWLCDSPQDYQLLSKLAGAYIECNQTEAAQEAACKLAALYPEDLFAKFLQARVRHMKGELPDTIRLLENALPIVKDDGENEVKSLMYNLLANTYGILGDCRKSTFYYLKASRCSIGEENKAVDYSNYLFHLNYLPNISQRDLFLAHLEYQKIFRGALRYTHKNGGASGEKIKIGYVSADLREHVVTFFSYAFFAAYDKKRFTVLCFSAGREDEVSRRIRFLTDGWVSIAGMDADRAAQVIAEQKVDILVDLSGHTKNNCLPVLARKPAPVQISGIGYFNTTGLREVDYFLTDVYCDPRGKNDAYFCEKLLRLPHSHFCYTPLRRDVPEAAEPPCLSKGYITFGSFNNFAKVNDGVLKLWGEILTALPEARLVLKSGVFGSAAAAAVIKKRFGDLGLPLRRVAFRPETYPYLHEYNDIDIALDTFPYPGGGTTCDALYMGVPVVTLIGERHGSRFGYSILKNIGLEELAAQTKEAYLKIALALARDKETLKLLRKNLRAMMQKSALMDCAQYMREMETCYQEIYSQRNLPNR